MVMHRRSNVSVIRSAVAGVTRDRSVMRLTACSDFQPDSLAMFCNDQPIHCKPSMRRRVPVASMVSSRPASIAMRRRSLYRVFAWRQSSQRHPRR